MKRLDEFDLVAKSEGVGGQSIGGRLPFECIALLLQGGGALGAYQAGLYQALAEADVNPNRVAGISIGAINAALIAGSPPEVRVEKLKSSWEAITTHQVWDWPSQFRLPYFDSVNTRKLANQFSATSALFAGVVSFFTPHMPPPWQQPAGSPKGPQAITIRALFEEH